MTSVIWFSTSKQVFWVLTTSTLCRDWNIKGTSFYSHSSLRHQYQKRTSLYYFQALANQIHIIRTWARFCFLNQGEHHKMSKNNNLHTTQCWLHAPRVVATFRHAGVFFNLCKYTYRAFDVSSKLRVCLSLLWSLNLGGGANNVGVLGGLCDGDLSGVLPPLGLVISVK